MSFILYLLGSNSPLSGSLKRIMEDKQEVSVPLGVFDVASEVFSKIKIDLTSFEYDRVGDHVILVDKVSDSLNNSHVYGEFDIPDRAVVRVHSRPVISWSGCPSGRVNLIRGQAATVNAVITGGEGPFHVFYEETSSISSSSEKTPSLIKNIAVENNQFSLSFASPATITLKAVKDGFCSGLIDGPSDCVITLVQPPTIKTTFNAIEAACVGHVGVEVTFLFTGTAPWIVNVREKSEHGIQTKKFISRTHNHVEMLSPQRAGTYHYEIIEFSDANYGSLSPTSDTPITYSQTIHPHPSARFIIPNNNRIINGCLGVAQSFKIGFGGSPPWNIKLQTVFPNSSILVSSFTEIKDEVFEYKPEDLKSPGTYIFILSEVTDVLGCRRTVNNEEITLTINTAPKVSFEVERSVMTLNSPKKIPVKVIGISPWTLLIKHSRGSSATTDTTTLTFTISSTDNNIIVREPGVYEILQVRDKVCQGSPGLWKTLTVDAVDMPSAKFDTSRLREDGHVIVMKKCEHSFERLLSPPIQISGRGSWTLFYRRYYLGNRNFIPGSSLDQHPHETLEFTTTRNSNVTFFLDSGLAAGNYVYEIHSISDFYYTNVLISVPDSSKRFELRVLKHPKAVFRNSDVKYQCIGESSKKNRLSLEFSGFAPFSVAYEVVDEFERVQLVNQVEWGDSHYPVPLISLNQT